MNNLINIFPDTENNVYTSENLSDSASKIVVNPNDRTIWIAGMPYGNRFIPTTDGGIDTENLPNNSEIFNDLENNKALGDYSHAEGLYTQTTNAAEHACGKYNKSTEGKTIFSIGIGTADTDEGRKNAIEVTNDDKVYVSGIGNYNGEGEIKDLSTVINKVIGEIGLNENLELETGGDLTNGAENVSNALKILDDNLVSTSDNNTEEINNLKKEIDEIKNQIEEGIGGDIGGDLSTVIDKVEKVITAIGLTENLELETGGVLTNGAENVSNALLILDEKLVSTTSNTEGNTSKITELETEINNIKEQIEGGIGGDTGGGTGGDLSTVIDKVEKVITAIGLNENLELETGGVLTNNANTVSNALLILDEKLVSTSDNTTNNTNEIGNVKDEIYTIKTEIKNVIDAIPESKLPEWYLPSIQTNENLSLAGGDSFVDAFGKLEKAIIDNEQVFTNATENIAYSVGLDDKLQYVPGGTITASSKSISRAIEILDNAINSQSTGADYAEMFEWEDGNPDSEDRVGYFVELNSNKIIKSESIENTIGIVSGTASVVSDNPLEWHNKYLKDKWGRYLKDDNGNIILNPEYDKTQEYQYRFFRKEWDAIGLIGKLFVRQDGTLSVGCKCKPSKNGIATISDDNTGYRVLEIIDGEVARILFK